jgi:hypothetical protein
MHNYRNYIEWAEKLVYLYEERGIDEKGLLNSSILLSWIAIESFVNNMIDDFIALPKDFFQLHERAFLLEKQIYFINEGNDLGKFKLAKDKYVRLADKIFFLIRKFNPTTKSFKGDTLWQDFDEFNEIRNKIAHPRKSDSLTISAVQAKKAIKTSKDIVRFISTKVWKKSVSF